MANFDKALELVLKHEGTTFTQTPGDLGGATKAGITIGTLNAYNGHNNSADDVRALTMAQIKDVYLKMFWTPMGLQGLTDDKLAAICFDQAVLVGRSRFTKQLQNIVGVLSDGIMGPATIAACNSKNTTNLILDILAGQTQYYIQLVQGNTSQLKFLRGWENRVIGLYNYVFRVT